MKETIIQWMRVRVVSKTIKYFIKLSTPEIKHLVGHISRYICLSHIPEAICGASQHVLIYSQKVI